MLGRLQARFEVHDRSLHILSGSFDSAYSGDVVTPGHELGFHVSILGAVYAIHRTACPTEEAVAADLAQEI
jgi:hypothetical protein